MSLDPASVFSQQHTVDAFDEIRISIASPDRIRSWSFGEIRKPETINYRTFKPEHGGLFCARIFGPVRDYECLCGKYKRMKYKGIICEKCGVEVTISKVRRERMGHIELVTPVAHVWFLRSMPSRIGLLLDMSLRELERVLYFNNYVVVDPGLTPLEKGQFLSEAELQSAQNEYGEDAFTAGIGAEAIRDLLADIDLKTLCADLRKEMAEVKSELRMRKLVKRLKIVEAFLASGDRPEWMVLTVIPVIAPELRPLVPLEGGRFVTSDLNVLYRRVINRNNRLKRLMDLNAPDIIIRNEKRILQESVDALFDDSRRARTLMPANKRPLKSLADILKGKQGRFRQNLLGKRVDYSGRSVIVVGPSLLLHQCGLPKRMALELFKPFIYAQLQKRGLAATLKQARKLVEHEHLEVWGILEEVIREHPVLLNRAPTLHRLGIQAFEPVLIEGKAIQLHPLVCAAFNADFDGDQMAVHVPLSVEAQLEARVLMMSTNNILRPSDGKPIIVPSQDIVMGLYYLTLQRKGELGEGSAFFGMEEVEHALHGDAVSLHARVHVRRATIDENGKERIERLETTPGRMMVAALLPSHPRVKFSLANRLLKKEAISEMIDIVYRHCGQKETVILCDRLMALGFQYACLSGVSIGKDDMVVPAQKGALVEKTRNISVEYEKQYADGLITQGEKYNKVVDAWMKCTDQVAEEMMREISVEAADKDRRPLNSIFMMADSGARGSPAQMKQLAGMRGLMAKSSGEIIETPIISNFKEGLTVLEYFNSTHGARKGLADTALKTANSGYLTRRLVDVAQDCTVVEEDCGTKEGLLIRSIVDSGKTIVSLVERVLGRVPVEDVKDGQTVIVKAGVMIGEDEVKKIAALGLRELRVRSALMCTSRYGICASCYGRDLARGTLVNTGEAVGIMAAQSIGEPGTQLTMRTFHIGGAAQMVDQSYVESSSTGTVEFRNPKVVKDSQGASIVLGRGMSLRILDEHGREQAVYRLHHGSQLKVKDKDKVEEGQRLVEWDPYTIPIITEADGVVRFEGLEDEVSLREVTDEATGIAQREVVDWQSNPRGSDLRPALVVCGKSGKPRRVGKTEARYLLSVGAVLSVNEGDEVGAGDVLARIPAEGARTRDITGGLPRVAELFEARRPRDHAVIASATGSVEFKRDYKNKRRILIHPQEGSPVEYLIPKGKHISVRPGDVIERGEYLLEGDPDPHDILEIMGVEELARYLVKEIQDVYRLQGVAISDKHIEVILRQMLQKVEIVESGDTMYLAGEQVDKTELQDANEVLEQQGKVPATWRPVLLGITKASLQTRSFISAAAFQETTRVLTEASVQGKRDRLFGLKENVIVGRLIPAGSGAARRRLEAAAREEARLLEALDMEAKGEEKVEADGNA